MITWQAGKSPFFIGDSHLRINVGFFVMVFFWGSTCCYCIQYWKVMIHMYVYKYICTVYTYIAEDLYGKISEQDIFPSHLPHIYMSFCEVMKPHPDSLLPSETTSFS